MLSKKTILLSIFMLGKKMPNMNIYSQDSNFHIYLCFGQSNMEGNAKIEAQDTIVDPRFQVLEAVDCPNLNRAKGNWYPAVPPLCRCRTGLSPTDYFGRTMVSNLPDSIKIGVLNVSIGGCKIELFDKNEYQTYVDSAPVWMKGMIKEYDGNPYARLVKMAKQAQKDGVIKGILLHQGESNPNDTLWTRKVKAIYENLMIDLDLNPENIPLLVGETVNYDQNGACAGFNAFISTLPDMIPNAFVIHSNGCEGKPDRLHFTAEGYRKFGKRYAYKMLSLY